ncbi:MAG: hypothetical protein HKO59_06095 [Phycisphaerales bacterium]|nr:prepilin-type N-terminal cleavage/methylation domain-containing protein [Phycisphaerae bacterium]NNF43373.1 hypothetical protein [Phycisphaerales bacterium]NNM25544.1 hypothetical protein [Phycisphaerales bacterium]
MSSRTRHRVAGYTLIELLIVVGVLGLAGSLLVPHLVGQDSMRVQAAVRKVIADLSFAQSDALAHQEYRRVHFYPDGSGYCIIRVDDSNYATVFTDIVAPDYIHDPLGAAAELGRYIVNLPDDERFEGVSITDVDIDGGQRDVVYDTLGGTLKGGGVPGSGGTIELTSGGDTFRITIAPFTGKLTVQRL